MVANNQQDEDEEEEFHGYQEGLSDNILKRGSILGSIAEDNILHNKPIQRSAHPSHNYSMVGEG
jgi:hypothetical protein